MTDEECLKLSKIVADSPDKIRRCDVFRLVEAAHNSSAAYNDVTAWSMADWIGRVRPDLADDASECAAEFPHDEGLPE